MDGCERLKSMMDEAYNKPLLKIYGYLRTREDMYDKYLNEEKTLKGMMEYIKEKAREQAVKGVAVIEDSVVYGLAIKYFNESNEALGIKKGLIEKKKEKQEEKTTVKNEVEDKPNEDEKSQISLFGGDT